MFLYARRAHRARAARLINVKNVSHARRRIAGVAGNNSLMEMCFFMHLGRIEEIPLLPLTPAVLSVRMDRRRFPHTLPDFF